jgi:pyruvate,water dikinase
MKKVIKRAKELLFGGRQGETSVPFAEMFSKFQEILTLNNQILELIAGANDILGGNYIFDRRYIETTCQTLSDMVLKLIYALDSIAPHKYTDMHDVYRHIQGEIEKDLAGRIGSPTAAFVLPYAGMSRDLTEAVGGKNASLAELHTFLGLRIPAGFAITTAAFYSFLEKNGLQGKISNIITAWQGDQITLAHAAAKIQQLIMSAPLPPVLEKEMGRALEKLSAEHEGRPLYLAVRSSAWGEDSERSFAGLYLTLLNILPEQLPNSYRQILASAYSETALAYRQKIHYAEEEVAMAIACQIMVDAEAGGVIYTLDPQGPHGETMLLNAAWGLGAPVVSGQAPADRFTISRQPPHPVTAMQLVRKETALRLLEKGGTEQFPIPPDQQSKACLQDEQIRRIAETGILIEKYFKKPQDIEFAFDRQEEPLILQARQLNIKPAAAPRARELSALFERYPVIFSGQGEIAQQGIGTGRVFLLAEEKDLDVFPAGAILVTRYASPLLAKVMAKASAIITDVGSTTGHLATIAREFRVPCILNAGNATQLLEPDQEITVDADANVVYQGLVAELQFYGLTEEPIEEAPEYRLLRRVLKKIEPLNLLDPAEENFTLTACRTLHDITRFVHEKAVEELIDRNFYHHHEPDTIYGKLKWDIPLDLVLIDIGGGLLPGFKKGKVTPAQITSEPMQWLLKGLGAPHAWETEPMSVDVGSFMSSMTKTFSPELATPKYVGQNLAVISKEYANVSLRLGYHFTMIDSYVTENINDNYAYFRFFGGVTDENRRTRRAKLLGAILAAHDFRIELHGDLVVARVKKIDKPAMEQRLYLLGLLVGFSRQLDVKMVSEQRIKDYIDKFNQLMGVTT